MVTSREYVRCQIWFFSLIVNKEKRNREGAKSGLALSHTRISDPLDLEAKLFAPQGPRGPQLHFVFPLSRRSNVRSFDPDSRARAYLVLRIVTSRVHDLYHGQCQRLHLIIQKRTQAM